MTQPYLFINPKAGMLKGCQTADQVREQLSGLKEEPDVSIGRTGEAISKFVKRVKKDKPQKVYIAGGDGTISTVIKALMDEDILFGLIPTGSMNNIGQSIGLGDDLESAVQTINGGKVANMDLGKVNGDIFIESIGIGLVAQIMDRVGEQDSKKEVLKVVKHTLAEAMTADTLAVKMNADGDESSFETVWLTVTNTGRAAAALVDPSADVQDKYLDVVYCEPLSLAELGRYTISYIRNSHIREEKFHRVSAKQIQLYLPEHVQVHVDGELKKWRRLNIEVVPAAIKVLAP